MIIITLRGGLTGKSCEKINEKNKTRKTKNKRNKQKNQQTKNNQRQIHTFSGDLFHTRES